MEFAALGQPEDRFFGRREQRGHLSDGHVPRIAQAALAIHADLASKANEPRFARFELDLCGPYPFHNFVSLFDGFC